jgi:FkbM family methyltransferase
MKRNPSKTNFFTHLKVNKWKPDVVVDVGVHQFGTPDLINAFPNAHHILIEPVKEFAGPIKRMYSSLEHTLYPIALGDHDGEMMLETKAIDGGSEVTHSSILSHQRQIADERTYAVTIKTLDWIVNQHEAIRQSNALLKLDVDGIELEILRGAKDSLYFFDIIVIEMPIRFFRDRLLYLLGKDFYLLDIMDPTYYHGFLSQVDMVFASPKTMEANPAFKPWDHHKFDWKDYFHWSPEGY